LCTSLLHNCKQQTKLMATSTGTRALNSEKSALSVSGRHAIPLQKRSVFATFSPLKSRLRGKMAR